MPEEQHDAEEIFGDFSGIHESGEDEEESPGLYSGGGDRIDGVYIDAKIDAVVSVKDVRVWVSGEESKSPPGTKWFKAVLTVKELFRSDLHEKDDKDRSKIVEGTDVQIGPKELPQHSDPKKMDDGKRFNLIEACDLAAALLQMDQDHFDPGKLATLYGEKSHRLIGRKVGMETDWSTQEKSPPNKDITWTQVYYNLEDFYPVNPETHERVGEKTPDQIQAETEAKS